MNREDEAPIALVTGATGFVGFHLTTRLLAKGWHVHVIHRPTSKRSRVQKLPGDLSFHAHDGTTESMMQIVGNIKPKIVIHVASCFVANHDSGDISSLVQDNILFGTQLLEAMRINGVPFFLNTGTSWEHYENKDDHPVCLYAATKQAFQNITQYYVDSGALTAITLKLFDTYGPKDPRPKLFTLLERMAKTKEVLAMSPGDQLIDLVYIDDVIDAYLFAAERLFRGNARGHSFYAVSSGHPIRLKAVVETFEQVANVKLGVQWGGKAYRSREVMVPWNRGQFLPGWRPKWSLSEGIRKILFTGRRLDGKG